jgi:hypothetical protein
LVGCGARQTLGVGAQPIVNVPLGWDYWKFEHNGLVERRFLPSEEPTSSFSIDAILAVSVAEDSTSRARDRKNAA